MGIQQERRTEREELRARGFKHCNKCDTDLPLTSFHKNYLTHDGLQSVCKTCQRQGYLAHPESHHRSHTKAATSPKSRVRMAVTFAKGRARNSGIPFSINFAWAWAEYKRLAGRCAATGVAFSFHPPVLGKGRKAARYSPNALSLDQKIPGGGYTPENTQLVSNIYNRCKHAFSEDDVTSFAVALLTHYGYTVTQK